VGRQAQVMPLQSSPMDQHDEATLSQVTSSVSLRYWMRMTEMAHVWEKEALVRIGAKRGRRCITLVDNGPYKETQAEDANQAKLGTPAEIQAAQHGQRKNEDDDVGDDVPRGVVVPERYVGDACAGRLGEPELLDRRAGEDDDQQLRYRPQSDKDEGSNDDLPHLACSQDTVVLKEEGEFGCS
jgi:hypothetical protein